MIVALEDAKYKLLGMRESIAELGSALLLTKILFYGNIKEKGNEQRARSRGFYNNFQNFKILSRRGHRKKRCNSARFWLFIGNL